MDIHWDGITDPNSIDERRLAQRNQLADSARGAHWATVFELLKATPELINSPRPGSKSGFAPLHQAAYHGEPFAVERLVALGAWRTLRNGRGERPFDVAASRGVTQVMEVLQPRLRHEVALEVLMEIQDRFHELIRERTRGPLPGLLLRLPQLEPLLELERPQMWFPVPGMYGGFNYWLERTGADARLVSESWSRIASGSGQRHEIRPDGYRLLEEGFV